MGKMHGNEVPWGCGFHFRTENCLKSKVLNFGTGMSIFWWFMVSVLSELAISEIWTVHWQKYRQYWRYSYQCYRVFIVCDTSKSYTNFYNTYSYWSLFETMLKHLMVCRKVIQTVPFLSVRYAYNVWRKK